MAGQGELLHRRAILPTCIDRASAYPARQNRCYFVGQLAIQLRPSAKIAAIKRLSFLLKKVPIGFLA